MMIVMILLICVAAFLFGFFLGTVNEPPCKPNVRNAAENHDKELERLKKEYENFLSYDGSEQA